ncbi:MAG: protoheme IX farnesyltransferase [Armatimonadetes bacterium]|nr:protoheme IX farnesyltransferase [Armatimonadota bacterium]NOG92634.1 protoheme IX farnesyltransferase [Armatimonadota bacterium]
MKNVERTGARVVAWPAFADYWAFSKPRVTLLVWTTTFFGMVLAGGLTSGSPLLFVSTLLGSWFVIAGANGLNQVLEANYDAKMRRTASRPIPSYRMNRVEGLWLSSAWALAGFVQLAVFVNWPTALLGLSSILLYAFAYTPLKRRSHLSTAIGAIPGAIPPLAGWVAVRGSVGPEAILLFALQFIWQFPHFWAIAWLLRDDYGRVGFKMLPFPDADAAATARCSFNYSLVLVALSIGPLLFVEKQGWYLVATIASAAVILRASSGFVLTPSDLSARKLLKASVLYLPVQLLAWALCA